MEGWVSTDGQYLPSRPVKEDSGALPHVRQGRHVNAGAHVYPAGAATGLVALRQLLENADDAQRSEVTGTPDRGLFPAGTGQVRCRIECPYLLFLCLFTIGVSQLRATRAPQPVSARPA